MRKTAEEMAAARLARKNEMVYRLAIHLQLSKSTTYEGLPTHVKLYFEGIRYCDIVKPLIVKDNQAGFSVQRLSIKYGLSSSAIQKHLTNSREPCADGA